MRVCLVVLLAVVALSSAQEISLGACPVVSVVTDFDATRYVGTWYENRKFLTLTQIGGKCTKAEYTATDEDGVVKVVNSQISSLMSLESSIEGSAKLDSDNGEGKLTVTLAVGGIFNVSSPYWVIGTDYESWASVWSCSSIGIGNLLNGHNAWILTRDREPSVEAITEALTVFEVNSLDISNFRNTDQSGCSN